MQRISSIMAFSAVTLLGTLFVGCGGKGDGSAEDIRGSTVKAVAPAARRDACEIITAEDIAQIEGQPIVARQGEPRGPYESVCEYGFEGTGPDMVYFVLKVYWRDGKEEWSTWGAGRSLGAKMLQDPDVPVDSIMRGDPLAGIGDGAHYGGILPSLVLKGDTLLEFAIAMLNNSRENFPILARKALSRL